MAKAKISKNEKSASSLLKDTEVEPSDKFEDDFCKDLIKSLNKESQLEEAHTLDDSSASVNIKRYISTGSKLLDYCVSNRKNGGLPEGRIIEIFGKYSSGKSLIGFQLAKSAQKLGGMVIYFDAEHSIIPEYLKILGVSNKNFIHIEKSVTEEVFQQIESIVEKVRSANKNAPVLIIVDSIAALTPLAEKDAPMEQNTIGLQARTLSKVLRKITTTISNQSITLVLLNQIRSKVGGSPYGPQEDSSGGNAIKFYSSVRINLDGGAKIKNAKEEIIGIRAIAKTEKNKISPPNRRCEFEIHFNRGIVEYEQIFDVLKEACGTTGKVINGKKVFVGGSGGWCEMSVSDAKTGEVLYENKFRKAEFEEMMKDQQTSSYIDDLLENVMVKNYGAVATEDPVEEEETIEQGKA